MDRLNKVAYVVAVVSPMTCVPQIVRVVETRSGDDVSIPCWVLSLATTLFWLYYALEARAPRVYVISGIGWAVMQALVVCVTFLAG